jgi:hypothetical protein
MSSIVRYGLSVDAGEDGEKGMSLTTRLATATAPADANVLQAHLGGEPAI